MARARRPLASSTIAAYRSDWVDFEDWCMTRGLSPLPAATDVVVSYLDDLSTRRRFSTVRRRVASIRAKHLDAGLAVPTLVPAVAAAVTRAQWRDRANTRATSPIGVPQLRAMSRALDNDLGGLRDRALLLVGYGAALRPGELVELLVTDISLIGSGLKVRTGRGAIVVPFGSRPELCAVRAWKAWRACIADLEGPAFRAVDRYQRIATGALSEKAVGRVVRRAAADAKLDPTQYSGLSLRRGTVAAAVSNGVSQRGIMHQTGHRSRRLVRSYMSSTVG